MTRPVGVNITVGILILLGLWSLFISIPALGAIWGGGLIGVGGGALALTWWNLVTGILNFIIAWGLFTLKRWAWAFGVGLAGVNLITFILGALNGSSWLSYLIPIIFSGIILYYLFQPPIRRFFSQTTPA